MLIIFQQSAQKWTSDEQSVKKKKKKKRCVKSTNSPEGHLKLKSFLQFLYVCMYVCIHCVFFLWYYRHISSVCEFLYIIIIMSHRQHGYPWPSLATSPYHSSPPAGLQGYILCPHIAAVCKFVLVVLLLHIHMWGSIGVHRLWARPCFSSSVPRVWFV